jgi:hypothetical protein
MGAAARPAVGVRLAHGAPPAHAPRRSRTPAPAAERPAFSRDHVLAAAREILAWIRRSPPRPAGAATSPWRGPCGDIRCSLRARGRLVRDPRVLERAVSSLRRPRQFPRVQVVRCVAARPAVGPRLLASPRTCLRGAPGCGPPRRRPLHDLPHGSPPGGLAGAGLPRGRLRRLAYRGLPLGLRGPAGGCRRSRPRPRPLRGAPFGRARRRSAPPGGGGPPGPPRQAGTAWPKPFTLPATASRRCRRSGARRRAHRRWP